MNKSEKARYPALRIIAAWYKAFGYVVGGIILIAGVFAVSNDGGSVGIGIIVGAVVFIILSISIAEIIQVFLDTEASTRSSASYLKELVDIQKRPEGPSEPVVADRQARSRRPDKAPEPPRSPEKTKQTPSVSKPVSDATQAQSIKNLIKHLHGDGLTAQEIVRELKSEGIRALDESGGWTEKAVHNVLLGR